ncbi:hypothetical protein QW71_34245 [Paenibacillus sp. IHB B 3415]|uniref:hypothetical protein n=1 Tax=Paenibacillus sp. IHB B 3415 TaxID=867080 RepID=UPI000575395C|nr:hypothetical protein [Paenibacillus sp. IHB B 3415]KHL91512.1 hypothetical protein QW71_34245 [Paenibacillus sp. IHB B 3415]
MTVCAFILEAQNEFEERFYIPIATEKFFYKYWMPGIQALGLEMMGFITPGIDIHQKELPIIIEELHKLKSWFDQNVKDGDTREYFFKRVNLLEEKLPIAYQREDAVVFMG